jgi:uncharacterized MnhB-related membrane protein
MFTINIVNRAKYKDMAIFTIFKNNYIKTLIYQHIFSLIIFYFYTN